MTTDLKHAVGPDTSAMILLHPVPDTGMNCAVPSTTALAFPYLSSQRLRWAITSGLEGYGDFARIAAAGVALSRTQAAAWLP